MRTLTSTLDDEVRAKLERAYVLGGEYMRNCMMPVIHALKDESIKQANAVKTTEDALKTRDVATMDSITSRQWDIIKAIGSAKGCSAATTYNEVGCSGTVFKEHVAGLVRAGLVGMSIGKVHRQKSHYYYLLPKGRAAFEHRFCPPKPVAEAMNAYPYIDFLKTRGFRFVNKINKSVCMIEKDASKVGLYFENTADHNTVYENVKVAGSRCYVICSSDRVKNAAIQGFARYSATGCLPGILIFIITAEELDKKQAFSRIEFHREGAHTVPVKTAKDRVQGAEVERQNSCSRHI